jgi:threonine/homoserine/homoserine lactone efflux protein
MLAFNPIFLYLPTQKLKMNIGIPVLLGFTAAAIGTTPPGLLNMTAAKVSLRDGRNRALWFAFGASVVVFFQTLIAVFFARFIDKNASISNSLQELGLVIFIFLTFFFFWSAKRTKIKSSKQDVKIRTKSSRFFMGMLLSALNIFPIPYYVFVSISLASYDWFDFKTEFMYVFALGTAIAAFIIFFGYITFFNNKKRETSFLTKNINYIIGTITGIVTIITLIKILNR